MRNESCEEVFYDTCTHFDEPPFLPPFFFFFVPAVFSISMYRASYGFYWLNIGHLQGDLLCQSACTDIIAFYRTSADLFMIFKWEERLHLLLLSSNYLQDILQCTTCSSKELNAKEDFNVSVVKKKNKKKQNKLLHFN